MSLCQAVSATLFSNLHKFPSLTQQQKAIFLRQCYTYIGSNVMKALSIIQYTPHKASITQYPMFFIVVVEKNRYVLFKDRVNLTDIDLHKIFKFQLECSCKQGWDRKIQKKAPFLCVHQILIYFVQVMDCKNLKIVKGFDENMDDLGEMLLFLRRW